MSREQVSRETATELLRGISGIVQYRRKDIGVYWTAMAAFDSFTMAERYAAKCSGDDVPWEYRAIEVAS
jgi:hypothetical protein